MLWTWPRTSSGFAFLLIAKAIGLLHSWTSPTGSGLAPLNSTWFLRCSTFSFRTPCPALDLAAHFRTRTPPRIATSPCSQAHHMTTVSGESASRFTSPRCACWRKSLRVCWISLVPSPGPPGVWWSPLTSPRSRKMDVSTRSWRSSTVLSSTTTGCSCLVTMTGTLSRCNEGQDRRCLIIAQSMTSSTTGWVTIQWLSLHLSKAGTSFGKLVCQRSNVNLWRPMHPPWRRTRCRKLCFCSWARTTSMWPTILLETLAFEAKVVAMLLTMSLRSPMTSMMNGLKTLKVSTGRIGPMATTLSPAHHSTWRSMASMMELLMKKPSTTVMRLLMMLTLESLANRPKSMTQPLRRTWTPGNVSMTSSWVVATCPSSSSLTPTPTWLLASHHRALRQAPRVTKEKEKENQKGRGKETLWDIPKEAKEKILIPKEESNLLWHASIVANRVTWPTTVRRLEVPHRRRSVLLQRKALWLMLNMDMSSSWIHGDKNAQTAPWWILMQVLSFLALALSSAIAKLCRMWTLTWRPCSLWNATEPSSSAAMLLWNVTGRWNCPCSWANNLAMCRCTCYVVRHRCWWADPSWNPWVSSLTARTSASSWMKLHGNLLPLLDDYDAHLLNHPPAFELVVPADGGTAGSLLFFNDFDAAEKLFAGVVPTECPALNGDRGDRALKRHQLQTMDVSLTTLENDLQACVTAELHPAQEDSRKRVLWEVYCGGARVSQLAESMGMDVEVFGLETGWDFELKDHRETFLQRQRDEAPDEVYFAPMCGPWSQMQTDRAILAIRQTQEKKNLVTDAKLGCPDWRTEVPALQAAEAPSPHSPSLCGTGLSGTDQQCKTCTHWATWLALSWKTTALKDLPGFWVVFHQCMFGCCCLDSDGLWKLVKKSTGVLTSKMSMRSLLVVNAMDNTNTVHWKGLHLDLADGHPTWRIASLDLLVQSQQPSMHLSLSNLGSMQWQCPNRRKSLAAWSNFTLTSRPRPSGQFNVCTEILAIQALRHLWHFWKAEEPVSRFFKLLASVNVWPACATRSPINLHLLHCDQKPNSLVMSSNAMWCGFALGKTSIPFLVSLTKPHNTKLQLCCPVNAVSISFMDLRELGSNTLAADAVAKRYRPWPKGLRADSLPWFDFPLVQGASRLRYTDKAQMQRPGHTGRKALATKKSLGQTLWRAYHLVLRWRARMGGRCHEQLDLNQLCESRSGPRRSTHPPGLGWATASNTSEVFGDFSHRSQLGWHCWTSHSTNLCHAADQLSPNGGWLQPYAVGPWQTSSTSWWTDWWPTFSSSLRRFCGLWSCSQASCRCQTCPCTSWGWCEAPTCITTSTTRRKPTSWSGSEVLLLERCTWPFGQDPLAWSCTRCDAGEWPRHWSATGLLVGLQDPAHQSRSTSCPSWFHFCCHSSWRCVASSKGGFCLEVKRSHSLPGPW